MLGDREVFWIHSYIHDLVHTNAANQTSVWTIAERFSISHATNEYMHLKDARVHQNDGGCMSQQTAIAYKHNYSHTITALNSVQSRYSYYKPR